MKTKISTKTALSTLFLLAVTIFAPACDDIFNPIPCDRDDGFCPNTGTPDSVRPR